MHVPVIRGFDPIIAPGARVLILGTVPSVRSLEVVQYYGHPRNAFWPIMEQLFRSGGGPLGYEERKRLVNSSGVAIWDVLASAERPGSLDAAIVGESVVANDIAGLLGDYTTIHTVFFNGAAAQALFARHVAPPSERELAVEFVRLPSTSPANASLTFEEKLEAWRVVERATASR